MSGESNIGTAEFCGQILAVLLLFSPAKDVKLHLWPRGRLPNQQVYTLVWPQRTHKQHSQLPARTLALDREKESPIDAVIPDSRRNSAALTHKLRQILTIPVNRVRFDHVPRKSPARAKPEPAPVKREAPPQPTGAKR